MKWQGKRSNHNSTIDENIWYKIYLLLNYKLSLDMFKGAKVRMRTIQQWQYYAKLIYSGRKIDRYCNSKLVQYIQTLMEDGVKPIEAPKNYKGSDISKEDMIKFGLATPTQIKLIYDSVGFDDELPDTTVGYSRTPHTCTNPITVNRDKMLGITDEAVPISNFINNQPSGEGCLYKLWKDRLASIFN